MNKTTVLAISSLFIFALILAYYLGLKSQKPNTTGSVDTTTPSVSAPTLKTYSNPKLKLSFQYPSSWQLTEGKTDVSVDPSTNANVYFGNLKLTKNNLAVDLVWGDGFGGGPCKILYEGGELVEMKIQKNITNPISFCKYSESGKFAYASGSGDSTIIQGEGYSLVFNTSPFSEAERPEIDAILASLSVN